MQRETNHPRVIFLQMILMMVCGLAHAQRSKPISQDATRETKALYKNLRKLSKHHILFGHKHATEYRHGWPAPYPGHLSVSDFIKFYNAPYTFFENDLKNLYGKRK